MKLTRCMQCGNNVALKYTCGYICNNCGFEARGEDSPNFQSESKRNMVSVENKELELAEKDLELCEVSLSDETK